MRKADYETLARELRQRIAKHAEALTPQIPPLSEAEQCARLFAGQEAKSLARYLADHLHVDRAEWLKACGLR
jgi:hypothetical protein